ncbi:MAG: type I restriction endonuclease subunit R [Candidatus Hodarchaeales archaeon]
MAEDKAREHIDELLEKAGWSVQDYGSENLGASLGVAIREFQLKTGAADYLLFIDRKAVGVIEAKPVGHTLGGVDWQIEKYVNGLPEWIQLADESIPFLYATTGKVTYFRDQRDPDSRSRRIFAYHKPETLRDWLKETDTLRSRLQQLPPLDLGTLRDCQFEAINNLEQSFAMNRPKALIQMATGSGKTYAAVSSVYRLIKHAKANRVLFLVDRNNLGRQAFREFRNFQTPDDGRRLEELYNIQHLQSNVLDPVSKVCISTIQRIYSMLTGRELDPLDEEMSLQEVSSKSISRKEVEYNPEIPIETFDFIIVDECHRSIYNQWSQVLEYFDSFIIGLTATPSADTLGYFDQNLVMEYSHERAIADGVNVGYDVYYIETAITKDGSKIPRGYNTWYRDVHTREELWQMGDEDYEYDSVKLDRDVVSPDQIRTVIRTFRDHLFTDIFPSRKIVPKTIIFSKNDSHADDILRIVREEFAKGDNFAKKITYKTTGDKPENLIKEFRNSPLPRIVVSVDMIATGTDIRPVECLLFMRDVKSRIYFEQMKGRGTRTIGETELHAVSSDAYRKTHFVVVDAVGVTESDKTDSRPLERNPSLTFQQLVHRLQYGNRDEDTLSSLANRLARLNQNLSRDERVEVLEKTGLSLNTFVKQILDAASPEATLEYAKEAFETDEPSETQIQDARSHLVEVACLPFDDPVKREFILEIHQRKRQIIDKYSQDEVTYFGYETVSRAQKTVSTFRDFMEANKDHLLALQVFYNQPYGNRKLNYQMIKELADELKKPPYFLDPETLWKSYEQLNKAKVHEADSRRLLTDLISILRYELQETDELVPFREQVEERYQHWLEWQKKQGAEFTDLQLRWLDMIKNHLIGELTVTQQDLQYAPFQQLGGMIQARKIFGKELPEILNEITQVITS